MKPYFKTLICDSETPVSLYTKLALTHQYALLLESVEPHQKIGRYSIIGFDPLKLYIFPAAGKENPLDVLRQEYEKITFEKNPQLPRFQAPCVGYFCYEVARHFEKISLPTTTNEIPEGIFFLPKNLIIFDHFEHTLTAITYNENTLETLTKEILNIRTAAGPHPISLEKIHGNNIPTHSNSIFEKKVASAQEKIRAGEAFQIVLCQEFTEKTSETPFNLYRRLRLISPSPYMYYLQYPDFSIIGSSPETLVRTEDEEIIIRPIAGTRRRGKNPEDDSRLEQELAHDEKEKAEHLMLVDLGRNDVGRVAEPGSVRVTRLLEIEKYSHVMHLVSEVRGKKSAGTSLFDIFKTAFPAGTLSGAPKIRAMEIIADLEKKPRGIYGGAVGYFDLSGNMDFAIAIRTMTYKKGTVSLRAGAGIVYDSHAAQENLECHNKARAPLSALATSSL